MNSSEQYIPPPFPFVERWPVLFNSNQTDWLTPKTFQSVQHTQIEENTATNKSTYAEIPRESILRSDTVKKENDYTIKNNTTNQNYKNIKLTKEDYQAICLDSDLDSDFMDLSDSDSQENIVESEIVMNDEWKSFFTSAVEKYNRRHEEKQKQLNQKGKHKKHRKSKENNKEFEATSYRQQLYTNEYIRIKEKEHCLNTFFELSKQKSKPCFYPLLPIRQSN
ncbi:hypothetical protein WA158_000382 [Blastocystis sp. Blastoise]